MIKTISNNSFNRLTAIDKNIIVGLARYRFSSLTSIMKFFTWIGDGYIWGIFCVMMFFINKNAAIAVTAASVIQLALQQIIKHIFCRRRPFVVHNDIFYLIAPPDKFSFPSGHTAGAFVIVFFLFQFYPVFFGFMLVLAMLIGISRVYLGLHYPTDILGGIALGYVSYILGYELSEILLPFIQ